MAALEVASDILATLYTQTYTREIWVSSVNWYTVGSFIIIYPSTVHISYVAYSYCRTVPIELQIHFFYKSEYHNMHGYSVYSRRCIRSTSLFLIAYSNATYYSEQSGSIFFKATAKRAQTRYLTFEQSWFSSSSFVYQYRSYIRWCSMLYPPSPPPLSHLLTPFWYLKAEIVLLTILILYIKQTDFIKRKSMFST